MVSPGHDAFPEGVAYYGTSNPSGTPIATTLNASSVIGSIDVQSLNTTYLDTDNPDVSGVQLNCILTGVTLQDTTGYQFWTQNALDYISENHTLAFGEDTWNFSSGGAVIPTDQSTIAHHSPNGSVEGGIYIGFGPYLSAPTPFALTLYLNSSVTATHDQELWFNYTLSAAGEPLRDGNYDWIEFNSTNAQHPGTASVAPFEASGTTTSTLGVPLDFEMDFGIAPYNGATMDSFSGNVSATLQYCPSTIASCSSSQIATVPAAEDFGSQTGETGEGLSFTYEGTTAYASGGPAIAQGLWGFAGSVGTHPGATNVINHIQVTGEPDGTTAQPYVFVFLNNTGAGSGFTWAPDVPTWHLMPGSYTYLIMLADYAQQTGSLTVGSSPTTLTATLDYSIASGVYTPLWAFNNSQVAGISTSGTGALDDQYLLFNNPTDSCTSCGGAANGNLSNWFFDYNDYLYPTFPGVLLSGTTAYADLESPVSFAVFSESSYQNWTFDLPIEFYHTSHVTLADATNIGTWPAMFEILMVAFAPAAQNPFPQGNVIVWDSTSDLIMSNHFGTESVPGAAPPCLVDDLCPPVSCYYGCVSPDELLLYGGENNTVWGNVFENPPATPLETGGNATYAGLAEGESGDLIYNNNFSVDNPAMLMAYDIYNDSCWASYAGVCLPLFTPSYSDTWNISNQSASNVAETVNGFALSGNVLGPQYFRQGGNYWWDWGSSENSYTSLPFTNEFNYTQNSTNLPPGYPALESSIRVGGDHVPLRLGYLGAASVTFTESGLTVATQWSVVFNGATHSASTSSIQVAGLAPGAYSYSFGSVAGYLTPASGQVTVSTSAVINITFIAVSTYVVSFAEVGLPTGTSWQVTLNGTTLGSTNAWVNFTLAPGTYPFTVVPPSLYNVTPSNGLITVTDANQTVQLGFGAPPTLDHVAFTETGLPTGTQWSMTFDGSTLVTSGPSMVYLVPPGVYTFSIPPLDGYSPSGLLVTEAGGGTLHLASDPDYTGILEVGYPVINASFVFVSTGSSGSSGFLGISSSGWLAIGFAIVLVGALLLLGLLLLTSPPSPPSPPSGKPASSTEDRDRT